MAKIKKFQKTCNDEEIKYREKGGEQRPFHIINIRKNLLKLVRSLC